MKQVVVLVVVSLAVWICMGCSKSQGGDVDVKNAIMKLKYALGDQVVWVVLFDSGQPQCQRSFPGIIETAKLYQDITVLAYATDKSPELLSGFVEKNKPPFAIWRLNRWKEGQFRQNLKKFGVDLENNWPMPLFLVFDRRGNLFSKSYNLTDARAAIELAHKY